MYPKVTLAVKLKTVEITEKVNVSLRVCADNKQQLNMSEATNPTAF